jgi:hypothetical protein
MRLLLLVLTGAFVASRATAQERWHQLPGTASAFAVELQSLAVPRWQPATTGVGWLCSGQ